MRSAAPIARMPRAGTSHRPSSRVIQYSAVSRPSVVSSPTRIQTERIARALSELGPNAHEAARRFLTAMIDADGRDGVQKLIARADRARRPKP